jgi:hypothetical protein
MALPAGPQSLATASSARDAENLSAAVLAGLLTRGPFLGR